MMMSVTETKNIWKEELLQINGGVRKPRDIKEVDFIVEFMDVRIITFLQNSIFYAVP